MKAQIEYIDRLGQVAVFEHDDFFDHMRHGAKGRQQHKGRDKNQNRIGYAVKYPPHVDISVRTPCRHGRWAKEL